MSDITLKLFDRFGQFSHAPTYSQPEYNLDKVRQIAKDWIWKGGSSAIMVYFHGKHERKERID